MRYVMFCLALCVSLAVVLGLPRSQEVAEDAYINLAREIAEELLDEGTIERANDPQYKYVDQERTGDMASFGDANNQRDNNVPPYVGGNIQRGNNPAPQYVGGNVQRTDNPAPLYVGTEDDYSQVAREVVDMYMTDRRNISRDARTASGALRAFNRQSKRTQRISEKIERENAELETLLLMAAADGNKMQRQLHNIDLTARSARPDPTCDIFIDCNQTDNRNFVDGREFRTIDGSCNNPKNYTWGMAGTQHRRILPNAYQNGRWDIRSLSVNSTRRPRNEILLPSARSVSNAVHGTTDTKPDNAENVSLALFYFMQFTDHDLAKTPEGEVGNRNCCTDNRGFCMPIIIGANDEHFSANYCMDARRSFTLFRCNDTSRFQNQINEITSYIDASMVYGSSHEEETTLRSFTGGHLKQSTRALMPNSSQPENLACNVTAPEMCFEAGDTRADVHPGLATYHTLFVREHNRIAQKFADIRDWSDERIYQETRKIIGAKIQHIIYEQMLPTIIREAELEKYNVRAAYKYDNNTDASMTQAFSMAFRYHNLMPHTLHLAKLNDLSQGQTYEQVNQEEVFLKPMYLAGHHYEGIDHVGLGMVTGSCPYVNGLVNKAARNLLFLDANGNSFDLATLNIMRGREWGMPAYTEYRAYCGLGNATTWEDLRNTTSEENINKMRSVYANVRDVDLWSGVFTENILPGSISGPTQSCLVAKHFANVKHGDRFWYESTDFFTEDQREQIKSKTSLAKILCDNLDVSAMITDVFRTNSEWQSCSRIQRRTGEIDLSFWPLQ